MSKLSDSIKDLTNAVKEAKNLVEAVDVLVESVSKSISKRVYGIKGKEGEVISYDDNEVIVVQEVGMDVMPKVKYDGNSFVIEFDSETEVHEVGCIDKESISAEVRNGVLTIKARRCKDESDKEN